MSCLRECSELGGGSEDSAAGVAGGGAGAGGERRSHGGSCHQHHPHYPPDAADHRRQSSGHGHHSDASGGEGAGDGWVRGRREVEVGGTSIAGGHLGGTSTSGGAATSVEVGGARRKVPQQVHVSSFIRISVYGFPWKSGKIIVWKWLMVIMASILNLFVMGKTFTFLQCKYPGRQCVSARSIIHPTQIFQYLCL